MNEEIQNKYFFIVQKCEEALNHRKKTKALGITPFEEELLKKIEDLNWAHFMDLVDKKD